MYQKLTPREKGQGLVEYALILVLVAVVVIVVLSVMGPSISNVYADVLAGLGGGESTGDYDSVIAPFCENRGYPADSSWAWDPNASSPDDDVIVYLQSDGLVYTRWESDPFHYALPHCNGNLRDNPRW